MSEDFENCLRAEDCTVAYGQPGLLLEFAGFRQAKPAGAGITMPPIAAAALLAELRASLAIHEASAGVAWSDRDAQLGALCDRRTGLSDGGETLGVHGAQMYRLLKNLPLNGYERSLKMQPARLLTERFLLGIQLQVLDPAQLCEIIDGLALPPEFRRLFNDALPNTRFLHFGHEAGPDGAVRKLYQEFGRRDDAAPNCPALLYTGYKWDPARPERQAVSEYRLVPTADLASLRQRVTALHPERPDIAAAARALLELTAARCGAEDLLYLDVQEKGNPRVSCDINLYAAQLRIADAIPAMISAADCFEIAGDALHGYLAGLGDARVGHVSSGTGRDGQPFLTVYYSRG